MHSQLASQLNKNQESAQKLPGPRGAEAEAMREWLERGACQQEEEANRRKREGQVAQTR